MSKLGIAPLKVGFEPTAAYDSKADKVYIGIKIDKKKTLEELRELIRKALGFAVGRAYVCKDTLRFILAKAASHEKALENIFNKSQAAGQLAASS
jgi:hypothetical protein